MIEQAIQQSMKANIIVSVFVPFDKAYFDTLGWSYDYAKLEDNIVDVWGWDESTPEGEQKWRIICHG